MPDIKAQKILTLLKQDARLKTQSLPELRKGFERFFRDFSSNPELGVSEVFPAGVPGYIIAAPGAISKNLVLFFHGGGFSMGSTRDHLDLCGKLSEACGCRILSLDYRLAPEHPFPGAVEDGYNAYLWLLEHGYKPENLALSGISAGGALALTTLLQLTQAQMPACAVGFSPAPDLDFNGESLKTNREKDWVSPRAVKALVKHYLDGNDPKNPLVSPLYGNFQGFPPILLQVGGDEILLDAVLDLAARLEKAGVEVNLEITPDMFHYWQSFSALLPQGREALEQAGGFVRKHFNPNEKR